MKINQVRFSKAVNHFRRGFHQRWGTEEYHDPSAPALFMGVYNDADVEAINEHNGWKIVSNLGRIRDIFHSIDPFMVVVRGGALHRDHYEALRRKYKVVYARFQIKDYSACVPTPLGDSVYFYAGSKRRRSRYKYNLMRDVEKMIKFPVIYGYQGHTMDEVIDKMYSKSFIHVKFAEVAGLTTTFEMAHMGRPTICNNDFPFCIPFRGTKDVARIIKERSKLIGTTPSSIMPDNFFFSDEHWRDLNFWTG